MQENHSQARIDEVKERMRAAEIEPLAINFEDIKRPMSEEEKEELDGEIREHVFEHNRIEEKKKEVTKALKDQMDKELDLLRAKSELREKGYHEVNTKCIIGLDRRRNVISIVDVTTGLETHTRMIKDTDLQTKMPLAESATPAEAATKAPEAIGIGFEGNRGEGPIEVEGIVIDDDEPLEDKEATQEVTQELVDMVGAVNEKEAWYFIETPEHTFYTEDKNLADIAETVKEARCYATFKYVDEGTRNKRLVSIAAREVEEPEVELVLPDDVQEADNIE